jgi:hypothetical protein
MSDKIIIHIDGVQGSGKSYLCSKLKNIKCIDTDDISKEAYDIIEDSQKTTKKIERTMKNLEKISNNIIKEYITSNKIIVFVGMTAKIPNPTHKFFIKITDFTTVYKRLLLRELDKIVKNEKKIKTVIKNMENPKINLIQRTAELSISFPVDYMDFLNDYKMRLKNAKNNNYKPKTQEQIIEFINNL